jgi:hypothetical protein
LSSRIVSSELGNYYNLAFGGGGIFDGLNILKRKENIPKNIYIEMNTVLRPENTELNKSVSSVVFFNLKKKSPVFLEDKKPLAIVGYYLLGFIRIINFESKTTVEKRGEVEETNIEESILTNGEEGNPEESLFTKMKKIHSESYEIIPDSVEMSKVFVTLKRDVKALQERGCKVVFFEVPVNYDLTLLPRANVIREMFFEEFPMKSNAYILLPSTKYISSDGLHLGVEEAMHYTDYFRSQIDIKY